MQRFFLLLTFSLLGGFLLGGCHVVYTGVYSAPYVYTPYCRPGWVTVPYYTYYGVYYRRVWNPCAYYMSWTPQESFQLGKPLGETKEQKNIQGLALRLAMSPESAAKLDSMARRLDKMDLQVLIEAGLSPTDIQKGLEVITNNHREEELLDLWVEPLAIYLDYPQELTKNLLLHIMKNLQDALPAEQPQPPWL